jgi:hypothetical protein
LSFLGNAPRAFGCGAFAGNPVAINSGLNNQVERVRRKTEFILWNRQEASISSHGGYPSESLPSQKRL